MKLIILIGVLLVPLVLVSAESTVVSTVSGLVKGKVKLFRGVEVAQFLSIPYADPPTGENRFRKPIPKSPWTGILQADQWGPHCMQNVFPGFPTNFTYSEDCLVLNVFTTRLVLESVNETDSSLRPVMVWIHGGGFNYGSANQPDNYDGTVLTALQDVVVVTINYRVGLFGFLHLPKHGIHGNMGLWDQRLAFQWVKDNIKNFGGDPNLVTIFGESAGSGSVAAHIISPHSKGLFKNAIMQSGSFYDLDRWQVPGVTEKFLDIIGCSSTPDMFKCLSSHQFGRHPEADKLLFMPVYGDEFMPIKPEEVVTKGSIDKHINLLVGISGNEGAIMLMMKDPITFSPINPINLTLPHAKSILGKLVGSVDFFMDAYFKNLEPDAFDSIRLRLCEVIGDVLITCPSYLLGHDLTLTGQAKVFAYYQSQKPSRSLIPGVAESKWLPASHGDDLIPVFGHVFVEPNKYTHEDLILSSIMMNTWTSFAKDGKPPSIGPLPWLPWTRGSTGIGSLFTMELNSQRIGSTDSRYFDYCRDKHPLPMDKPYSLEIEFGAFVTTIHDEL